MEWNEDKTLTKECRERLWDEYYEGMNQCINAYEKLGYGFKDMTKAFKTSRVPQMTMECELDKNRLVYKPPTAELYDVVQDYLKNRPDTDNEMEEVD